MGQWKQRDTLCTRCACRDVTGLLVHHLREALDQSKLKKSAKIVEKQFWTAPSIKDGVERLKKGDDFRFIAEDGLRAVSHHDGRLTDRIDLHEWITMSLQRATEAVNGKLSGGLAFLATVGSVSPFVGLFGTVMGILQALIAIGVAGQASIDKVAGPVGEALIMTAIGLAVAVPRCWATTGCCVAIRAFRTISRTSRAICMPTWSVAPAWAVRAATWQRLLPARSEYGRLGHQWQDPRSGFGSGSEPAREGRCRG